jgi:hypothetical protein
MCLTRQLFGNQIKKNEIRGKNSMRGREKTGLEFYLETRNAINHLEEMDTDGRAIYGDA